MSIGLNVKQSMKELTKGIESLEGVLEAARKEIKPHLKKEDSEEVEALIDESGVVEKIESLKPKVEELLKRIK